MPAVSAPGGFRGRFLADLPSRSAYSEGAGPYRIVPAAVALPEDLDDLCLLARHAADAGTPLTPRGAGSGMPGGNVGSGIVVDLRAFDRPARVSLEHRANVGAAVTWGTVEHIANHFHLRLPPDPSSGAFCTIGGMVATNAAGARSLRAGSIRGWVHGVELVTVDGEAGWLGRRSAERPRRASTEVRRHYLTPHLAAEDRFEAVRGAIEAAAGTVAAHFPRTRKNSSGYALDQYLASGDLVDLVIGSEGTLGFVTRVELALERTPDAQGTLLLGLGDLRDLGDLVTTLLAFDPAALELLDRTFLDLAGTRAAVPSENVAAVLIAEFERNAEPRVRDTLAAAADAARPCCTFVRSGVRPEERKALWRIRHAASPALANLAPRRSLQVIEDGCVPVPALGRYVEGVRAAAADLAIQIVAFGHAGDGHLHVNALVDPAEPGFEERLEKLLTRVTALLAELGGTPSGEHGDGRLRTHLLERIFGPDLVALFGRVKDAFDPAGILNPGVIIPTDDGRPLAALKVGPEAVAIPAPIADGLREMERSGGWTRSPLELVRNGA